ncbi:MAG: hypothetical protein ABIF71_10360 [Planctomycetota bacterium]
MEPGQNGHIHKAFEVVREMIILADEGEAGCQDNGCVALCGLIRDDAYRIKAAAEQERDRHIRKGSWEPAGK